VNDEKGGTSFILNDYQYSSPQESSIAKARWDMKMTVQ